MGKKVLSFVRICGKDKSDNVGEDVFIRRVMMIIIEGKMKKVGW